MDAISYSKASSAYKLAGQAIVGLTTKADLTTSGILVPVGTTATRPTLGAGEVAIRYNTDVGGLEEWNGTAWKNVSADITAVAIKGTDTVANILAKTGMVAEDLWIASDTLDGYVYDGSSWINIGPLQGPQGTAGISAYQVALNNGFVGTEVQWLASLVGPQGIQGVTGNGVASVVKTNTVGLVDTYTITFTDTTTTTFNITNGLNGTNGVDGQDIDHVSKTAGTSAPGTTDTYTVWGDLAETINLGTFNVYNGTDGLGAGDMAKAVYDTTNNGIVDNAEKVNGLTVETAVPAGALFTDTIYIHPITDGNLHVPATGTTNNGKVLTAGATEGVMTWEYPAAVPSTLDALTDVVITNPVTDQVIKYNGTNWVNADGSTTDVLYSNPSYIATEGQTTFNVTYDVGFVIVYINGLKIDSSDYTATNGTSIVLNTGVPAGTLVDSVAFKAFSIADVYSKTEVDTGLGLKQDTLVSGTNIKSINGESVLGSGDIAVGAIDTNIVTTSTSITMTKGSHYNVTTAGLTLTLPLTPTTGDKVVISVGDFLNTTVARNGQTIGFLAENLTIDRAYITIELQFLNSTWRIV